jgi:hypothetical protein
VSRFTFNASLARHRPRRRGVALSKPQADEQQLHTIRGAISGALKKKLGLTVEATRTREVGPNKIGAKGNSTVYRITGSPPEAN